MRIENENRSLYLNTQKKQAKFTYFGAENSLIVSIRCGTLLFYMGNCLLYMKSWKYCLFYMKL